MMDETYPLLAQNEVRRSEAWATRLRFMCG